MQPVAATANSNPGKKQLRASHFIRAPIQ